MNDCGSVLMEYVVLCCLIGVVLLKLFQGDFYDFEKGYVGLGAKWSGSVQLLHRAIALPIP